MNLFSIGLLHLQICSKLLHGQLFNPGLHDYLEISQNFLPPGFLFLALTEVVLGLKLLLEVIRYLEIYRVRALVIEHHSLGSDQGLLERHAQVSEVRVLVRGLALGVSAGLSQKALVALLRAHRLLELTGVGELLHRSFKSVN